MLSSFTCHETIPNAFKLAYSLYSRMILRFYTNIKNLQNFKQLLVSCLHEISVTVLECAALCIGQELYCSDIYPFISCCLFIEVLIGQFVDFDCNHQHEING